MKTRRKASLRKPSKSRKIYLVAEGTGETISKITRSSLAQFGGGVEIKKFFQVTSAEKISEVIKAASKDGALVVFSIVEKTLRDCLLMEAEDMGIKAIDVIGHFILQLSGFLAEDPMEIPGRQHLLDEEYFRRMEAVNYAVKHDDGKAPEGLKVADLVLTGLSRTGKTPLATYLAHQGLKVANIPLHPEMDPPEELFRVDYSKVFGLIISVEHLVKVRQGRLEQLGLSQEAKYADPVKIADELEWCEAFFRKYPRWHIIDISSKAVEEVAATVVNLCQK